MAITALIADHRKDQLLPLAECLLQHGVEATACTGGTRALAAVIERAEAGDPYDLVIAHVDLSGIPGLRLLYEARRRHLATVAAVTCTSVRRSDPRVETMIGKVGAAVLMLPIDWTQVGDLLGKARERRQLAGIDSGAAPVARPLGGPPAVARRPRSIDIDPVLELSPEEFEIPSRPEVDTAPRHMSSGELSVAGYLIHGSGMYEEDDVRPLGTRRRQRATAGTAASGETTGRHARSGGSMADDESERPEGPDEFEEF